jgi:hypothetical protein
MCSYRKEENMNKRIQQLALECGAWHQVYDDKRFMVNGNFDVQRFAELIVQECLSIVEPTSHHQAFAPSYLGDVEGLELLESKVKQIRQHFGVEK